MDNKVLEFTGYTKLDLPASNILEGALAHNLASCIVIGETQEDDLYVACSMAKLDTVIYLLELAKHKLMSGEYDQEA